MPPPRWGLAFLLFSLTFFCTTTLGVYWTQVIRTDVMASTLPLLDPGTVFRVWGDPWLLRQGLLFSVPAMLILLSHELGHYIACRHYRLPATLPYFIPLPIGLGTLGAFIRIRVPIRSKRELFDVGVAGPLAGFAVLLPFLIWGVAQSTLAPAVELSPEALPPELGSVLGLIKPGIPLGMWLATLLFHGPPPEGMMLDLHPTALAAWMGMLVTALNLIPLGQLDGGHILYARLGALQTRLAKPLWLLLLLLGFTTWLGWLLWCGIVLAMGLKHPPVRNETTPLDPLRRRVALLALLVLILSFTPVPLEEVPVQLEAPPAGLPERIEEPTQQRPEPPGGRVIAWVAP